MSPHKTLECVFPKESVLPSVFPHHLFMVAAAAAAASKQTGLYPLTGMESTKPKKENRPQLNTLQPKSPEVTVSNSQGGEEEEQKEVRLIVQMTCTVKPTEDGSGKSLSLLLKLDDKMNRQLSCKVPENETSLDLANELIHYGLINELDREKVANKIDEHLNPQS